MMETRREAALLPRRAIFAAALSALGAGGFTALAIWGGLSRPHRASFQFTRGLTLSTGEDERLRAFLAGALSDDRIFVTIVGHTGSAGDAAANLSLSEARAALAADMAEALGIAPERITARGVGGGAPLDKQTNENARAYQSRLARIDVTLQLRR